MNLSGTLGRRNTGVKHCLLEGKDGSKRIITVESAGGDETAAVVVRKFVKAPQAHPGTVCFLFSGISVTHHEIRDAVREQLTSEQSRVVSVQFSPRNAIHATTGLPNRWIIRMDSQGSASELVKSGIFLRRRRLQVRHYGDVLREEYKEYLQVEKAAKEAAKRASRDHKKEIQSRFGYSRRFARH